MEQKKSKIFINPIFKENPILVSLLGMCPFLGSPTSTINNAIGIGVAVILVLLCTNTFISLIRKIVPNEVRIPVFIVIIACFVTMVEYLMKAFTPDLSTSLGIFIPMITVNCIILGRAEAFASKNSPLDAALDGLGTGVGFTMVCLVLAIFREVLSTGGITLLNPFTSEQIFSFTPLKAIAMPIFKETAGSFIIFGVLLGTYFFFTQTRKEKLKNAKKVEVKKETPVKEIKKVEEAKEEIITPIETKKPVSNKKKIKFVVTIERKMIYKEKNEEVKYDELFK